MFEHSMQRKRKRTSSDYHSNKENIPWDFKELSPFNDRLSRYSFSSCDRPKLRGETRRKFGDENTERILQLNRKNFDWQNGSNSGCEDSLYFDFGKESKFGCENRSIVQLKRPKFDYQTRPHFDFQSRSNCDFRNRPNCDFRNRPNCDFQNRPNCDFQNRPNCDFQNRPNCDFQNRPNCDYRNRPNCDYRNRPNCDYRNGPNFNWQRGPDFNFQSGSNFTWQQRPNFDWPNEQNFDFQNGPNFNWQHGPNYCPSYEPQTFNFFPADLVHNEPPSYCDEEQLQKRRRISGGQSRNISDIPPFVVQATRDIIQSMEALHEKVLLNLEKIKEMKINEILSRFSEGLDGETVKSDAEHSKSGKNVKGDVKLEAESSKSGKKVKEVKVEAVSSESGKNNMSGHVKLEAVNSKVNEDVKINTESSKSGEKVTGDVKVEPVSSEFGEKVTGEDVKLNAVSPKSGGNVIVNAANSKSGKKETGNVATNGKKKSPKNKKKKKYFEAAYHKCRMSKRNADSDMEYVKRLYYLQKDHLAFQMNCAMKQIKDSTFVLNESMNVQIPVPKGPCSKNDYYLSYELITLPIYMAADFLKDEQMYASHYIHIL